MFLLCQARFFFNYILRAKKQNAQNKGQCLKSIRLMLPEEFVLPTVPLSVDSERPFTSDSKIWIMHLCGSSGPGVAWSYQVQTHLCQTSKNCGSTEVRRKLGHLLLLDVSMCCKGKGLTSPQTCSREVDGSSTPSIAQSNWVEVRCSDELKLIVQLSQRNVWWPWKTPTNRKMLKKDKTNRSQLKHRRNWNEFHTSS